MTWLTRGLTFIAAAAALHGAIWSYAAGRLEAETAAALDDLRRQGWVVAADAPRRTGWPLAAGVRYRQVLLDGAPAGVPIAWSADELDLTYVPPSPARS